MKQKWWKKIPERWVYAFLLNFMLFCFYDDVAKVSWDHPARAIRLIPQSFVICMIVWKLYFERPKASSNGE